MAGSIDAVVSLPTAVEQLERTLIVNAIGRSKGNKTRAADELGISRRNLIRKLQAYRLETEVDPTEPEE